MSPGSLIAGKPSHDAKAFLWAFVIIIAA